MINQNKNEQLNKIPNTGENTKTQKPKKIPKNPKYIKNLKKY